MSFEKYLEPVIEQSVFEKSAVEKSEIEINEKPVAVDTITKRAEIGDRAENFYGLLERGPEEGEELPTWLGLLQKAFDLEIGKNEGKLPIQYSDLTIEEVAVIVQNPDIVYVDLEQPDLTEKDLERAKLRDAVRLFERTIEQAPLIKSIEQSIDPFGKNLGDIELTLFADLHFTPSDTEKAGATNAFKIYQQLPVQFFEALQDKKIAREFFKNGGSVLDEESARSKLDLLYKRDILTETARHEFIEWLFKMALATPRAAEGEQAPKQVFVDLGDAVHGGGLLEDKLDISMRLRELFIERLKERRPDLEPLLIEIFGNHEERSRDPNATEYLNEVYGHRTFTQIAGDNVMIACFDTSMMGEGWMNQFNLRATDAQKEIIYQRKKIQDAAWERVKAHDGQVVLIGHDPSQMLAEFKKDIGDTNVVSIIGGHIHKESHDSLDLQNAKGQNIEMHVVDSFIHVKGGKPQSPKAMKLSIEGERVGVLESIKQPQGQFESAIGFRLSDAAITTEDKKRIRAEKIKTIKGKIKQMIKPTEHSEDKE